MFQKQVSEPPIKKLKYANSCKPLTVTEGEQSAGNNLKTRTDGSNGFALEKLTNQTPPRLNLTILLFFDITFHDHNGLCRNFSRNFETGAILKLEY